MKADVLDASVRDREPGVMRGFEREVAGAAGVRNAADGRLVVLAARALRDGLWQGWGIHTPIQWLMWKVGVSRVTARRVVLVASRADELPVTLGLLAEGRLSLDQAATVARYTPADYEASVCEVAVNATVNQIRTATKGYGFDVEADDGADDRSRRVGREVSFGSDDDGQWWARIRLAADEGKVVEEALTVTRDRLHRAAGTEEGQSGGDSGRERVGWADAVVGMAHCVLGHDAQGAERRPRTAVHVHLERPEPGCGSEWLAQLHAGPVLPSWLRRYLVCDSDIEVVWTADGIPVTTARHQRTAPDRIRRLVEKRDQHQCRVPGCDSTLWLQVHHVAHWEDGGETVTSNLCCLCSSHHRMHHRGRLGITGDADVPGGLRFTTEHGLPLDVAGRASPPGPGAMPEVAPYDGPTGERLHTKWVDFDRRPRPPGAPPPGRPTAA